MANRPRPLLLTGALAIAVLGAPAATGAQDGARITLNANYLPLKQVIRILTRAGNLRCEIDPRVSDLPITFSTVDTPVPVALQYVVDAAAVHAKGLKLERKPDGGYAITLPPGAPAPKAPPRPPEPARRVTLIVSNLSFREAVRLLLPGEEEIAGNAVPRHRIEAGVPDVPIVLHHSADDEGELVRLLVRQAASLVKDLGMEQQNGVYVIGIRPGLKEPPPKPGRPPADVPGPRRIVCGMRNVPLPEAFRTVYGTLLSRFQSPVELAIAPDVPKEPLTFSYSTSDPLALERAFLRQARRAVKGLSVERQGDRLIVSTSPAL